MWRGRRRASGREFKELAHVIVGGKKSIICRVGWQVGNSGRIPDAVLSRNSSLGNLSLCA